MPSQPGADLPKFGGRYELRKKRIKRNKSDFFRFFRFFRKSGKLKWASYLIWHWGDLPAT